MYLHLGQSVIVRTQDVLGIFDLDNASWAYKTREYLEKAEKEGRVTAIGSDLPRSMVLIEKKGAQPQIYLSPLSAAALGGRAEHNSIE